MGNSVNAIKVTAGKETTAGTAVSRTAVMPMRALPTIVKSAQNEKDPVIIGSNMASGKIMTAYDVKGQLPLSFRPCKGIGLALKSLLGSEATPVQVGACIKIRYTGSENSCKITASASGDTLTSEIGDKGSESGDASFGSAGTIDLTSGSYDTIDELVAAIEGYTDYEAEKLFEQSADYDTSNILDITAGLQGKEIWVLIWFGSADSGVYKHVFTPDLGSDERPTLSIQKDGFQDNYLYAGCVADSLSVSAALKGFVETDLELLGFSETGGQSESALNLEDRDPMAFSSGSTSIGAVDTSFISQLNMEIANNHNTEGYGQGSLGRQYHAKSTFGVTGDVQVRLDSDTIDFRALAFASTLVSFFFEFVGQILSGGIPEAAYIELPYCGILEPDYPENNGVIDLKLGFEAYKPKGTIYNEPFTLTILTTDAAEY